MNEEHKTNLIKNLKTILTCDDKDISKYYHKVKEILLSQKPKKSIKLSRTKVKKVKPVDNTQGTDVYDIGMRNEDHPWFFANNMLVHNSVYFSAYPILKAEIMAGKIPWTKENVVQLYDQVAGEANKTFPKFMLQAFHCPKSRSDVIAAGREIVAESGLYITKKRYAALVYDEDGKRKDVNGEAGKVKAMGLDLRRSDTPVYMQDFLKDILFMVLTSKPEAAILERIEQFRRDFKDRPGWEKGTPKRVNNLTKFRTLEEKQGKANMPGHVRAALNWNTLKRMNSDKYSQEIVDGMKTIVCKLKPNPMGFTSVSYPTDELRLPQWFKDLPFDDAAMENVIIDNKIDNLIGVLNYDIESTKQDTTFHSLFDFGE
jgi:hypothetical protein